MAADSEDQIYDFEGGIEAAFDSWFSDQTLELKTSDERKVLPDDFISIEVDVGAATEHVNQDGDEYDQYEFKVAFTVKTLRHGDTPSSDANIKRLHKQMVAKVRRWLSPKWAKSSALETYLTLYAIDRLVPRGTDYDEGDGSDETTLNYDGQFSILQSAWIVS